MTPPTPLTPAAWTLATCVVCLWATGWGLVLVDEPVRNLYPKLSAQEVVECDCVNGSCDSSAVFWFRSDPSLGGVHFLAKYNYAERFSYGPGVDRDRFKLGKKGGAAFQLRILAVREEDGGVYSCILKDKSGAEVWRPGSFLRPGVNAPTPTPPEKNPNAGKPKAAKCSCPGKTGHADCDPRLLWSLLGLAAALFLLLFGTLCYFSRLPKKCRHRFVKARP